MKEMIIRLVLLSTVGLVPLAWAAQEKGETTVTLEGQVVCSFCWFEEDRKVTPYGNEGDLKCAVDCMKKGKSQALAVTSEDGFKLYLLEPGKLKRDRKDWLDFIAKQVKVTGTIREDGAKRYLRVDSIQVVSPDTKPVKEHGFAIEDRR